MRIMLPVCDLFLLGLQFCNACMIRQFDSKQPVQFGCHVNFILSCLKPLRKWYILCGIHAGIIYDKKRVLPTGLSLWIYYLILLILSFRRALFFFLVSTIQLLRFSSCPRPTGIIELHCSFWTFWYFQHLIQLGTLAKNDEKEPIRTVIILV
jgi:hypothetical protein